MTGLFLVRAMSLQCGFVTPQGMGVGCDPGHGVQRGPADGRGFTGIWDFPSVPLDGSSAVCELEPILQEGIAELSL